MTVLLRLLCVAGIAFASAGVAAIELTELWDFDHPDVSERRFRDALQTATGDDALILQTQISRSHGLRGDFARARATLGEIAAAVQGAGPEARVRYQLELGRSYVSATHPPESRTPQALALARTAYVSAFELARDTHLDGLAVDALHMMAFVDRAPADQLRWTQQALALVEASDQAAAKRWEASLRNNIGFALHDLGQHEQALTEFQRALKIRQAGTDAEATRDAQWAVGWELRALGRNKEAIAVQQALAHDAEAAGAPAADIYEELETLYRAQGDEASARRYGALKTIARP